MQSILVLLRVASLRVGIKWRIELLLQMCTLPRHSSINACNSNKLLLSSTSTRAILPVLHPLRVL